jgi:Flp pilus assembly protein TadG
MRSNRQPGCQHGATSRQTGQSLAEFALTMPLLIALLVGIMLLAWVGFAYVSVTSAARMGARHMVSYPIEAENPARFPNVDDEITHMVTSTMPFLDWQRAEITISPQPPDKRLVGGATPLYVAVQVRYPVNNPVIQIPYVIREGSITLLPPITLQATSRMRLD